MSIEDNFLDTFFDFKYYVMDINKDFYKIKMDNIEEREENIVKCFTNNSNNITGEILALIKNIPKDIIYSNLSQVEKIENKLLDIPENNLFLNYVISMIKNHSI